MLVLLGLLVWLLMKVNEALSLTLGSDVSSVTVPGPVNFSGVVTDKNTGDPVPNVGGEIDGSAPDGTIVPLPFTTGPDGKFAVQWVSEAPFGVWNFVARALGSESPALPITASAAS